MSSFPPVPSTAHRSGRSISRQAALAAVLMAVCVLVALPASRPVAAQSATHIDTVRAEYGIMLDSYVKPLDPTVLLQSAWDGASRYLRRHNVSFQATLPALPSDRDQAFSTFSTSWQALAAQVGDNASMTEVAFAADDAMASSVQDDHTGFLTPDEYNQEQQALGGADSTAIGIGIESSSSPPHIISDVAPGSGAEQAGVMPGDTIVAVNGADVTALAGGDYRATLAGGAGTTLTLTVDRPNAGRLDLPVTLGPYRFPIFSYKVLPNGLGYMRLRSFVNPWTPLETGETVVQELDDALNSFEAAGVKMWVLDLRDNLGGVTLTNQAFLGRFLADGRIDVDQDLRGDRAEDLVDGHAFPVQRPLAVLINGNSASSSEVVASALKEYNRATLVGERTAGGLGSALLFPLPDGAGIEVTVATVVSGRYQQQIDNVGVAPDVPAPEPTAADLAAGRDPAIDAAVAALQGQQSTTIAPNTDATLSEADLRNDFGGYEVSAADVPPAPEIQTVHYFGDYVINRYNQWNDWEGPGSDGFATRDLARQLGWQGAIFQWFGQNPIGPAIVVEQDLYATAQGAAAAMNDDFPDLITPTDPPIQLGDQTVAYRGHWTDTGSVLLQWRHGRLLFTVQLQTVPGEETFDPLVTLARTVEARYQANPFNQ